MNTSVSFRDPSGFVLQTDGQVFRVVRDESAQVLREFLGTALGRKLIERGEFVGSRSAEPEALNRVLHQTQTRTQGWKEVTVLEHTPVRFATFPHEWPSAMLREAALLTVNIADQLLDQGFGLKDATPYNILFNGPDALLVDALSVEKRDPADPIWRPLGQFLQTFLYPLLLENANGTQAHQIFAVNREGISAGDVYRQLSLLRRLRGPNLRWVSMTNWLGKKKLSGAESYASRKVDPELAKRMLRSNFSALRKVIQNLPLAGEGESTWSHYSRACHYDDSSRATKREFVTKALQGFQNGRVLDLGANDGEYSFLAAGAGHDVVSADLDATAVNRLWRRAKQEHQSVLPIVLNIANPTPGTGWGNQECRSFLTRAQGQFDCVLMLALLHHLTVTERIPLPMVLDMAASVSRKHVVIEWVSPQDPMYQALLRGRDALHEGDTREAFEAACQSRFRITASQEVVPGRRWIYLLSKEE